MVAVKNDVNNYFKELIVINITSYNLTKPDRPISHAYKLCTHERDEAIFIPLSLINATCMSCTELHHAIFYTPERT